MALSSAKIICMKAPVIFRAVPRCGFVAFICFLLPFFLPEVSVFADDFRGVQDSDFVIADWQVQDGLPSARIHDVVQTRDGYLWLATLDGLARYDGVRFERYYDSDTAGLASSMVSCLFEDNRGWLWYGTQSGELGWKDSGGFHKLQLPPSRLAEPVLRLVETSDGTVWAVCRQTLLPVKDGVAGEPLIRPENHLLTDICPADGGDLWLLVDGGNVYRLESRTKKLTLTIPGQSGEWRSITAARAGGLWVRDGQCIRRWLNDAWVENRGVLDLQVTENVVFYESKSGTLLFGTSGQGVWMLEPDGSQHRLDHSSSGLSQDQVLSLCEIGRAHV